MKRTIVLIAAYALCMGASAKINREQKAVAAFKHSNPCPSTGKPKGSCPGYVVDHIRPLCAGGPDKPENMQWQTVEAAKAKDKEERKECRK